MDEERYLITRIKPTKTTTGRDVIHLFSQRLQYPALYLFELPDLNDVGIDHTTLPLDKETPCKFWAYYKLGGDNSEGKPYKDVLYLEPIGHSTQTQDQDPTAILDILTTITGELRTIRLILLRLTPGPPPATDNQDLATSGPESANLATELFAGTVNNNSNSLDQFYDLVASGLGDGTLHQDDVDAVQDGNFGYDLAADCLRAEMTRRQSLTQKQRSYREAVISRLMELQRAAMEAKVPPLNLDPGWQWTASTDDLIEAGKTLKQSLEV